jgi:hypothetical protein
LRLQGDHSQLFIQRLHHPRTAARAGSAVSRRSGSTLPSGSGSTARASRDRLLDTMIRGRAIRSAAADSSRTSRFHRRRRGWRRLGKNHQYVG